MSALLLKRRMDRLSKQADLLIDHTLKLHYELELLNAQINAPR